MDSTTDLERLMNNLRITDLGIRAKTARLNAHNVLYAALACSFIAMTDMLIVPQEMHANLLSFDSPPSYVMPYTN